MISLHQVDDAIIHSLHLSIHRVLGGEGSLVLPVRGGGQQPV